MPIFLYLRNINIDLFTFKCTVETVEGQFESIYPVEALTVRRWTRLLRAGVIGTRPTSRRPSFRAFVCSIVVAAGPYLISHMYRSRRRCEFEV